MYNVPFYVGAGFLVATYGVSTTIMRITEAFMSTSFTTIAYIGFSAGFASATIAGAGLTFARSYWTGIYIYIYILILNHTHIYIHTHTHIYIYHIY